MKLYLDTCVLITAFEQNTDLGQRLQRLFWPLQAGGVQDRATSDLTFAECLVRPIREQNWRLAKSYKAWLNGNDILAVAPIDVITWHQAAMLRAEHNLRIPDAVHIASALRQGCTHILTGDKRWKAWYKLSLPLFLATDNLAAYTNPYAVYVVDCRDEPYVDQFLPS